MARGNGTPEDPKTAGMRPAPIAVDPPSLDYPRGSLIVLCGVPGSGKSTLAKLWPDAVVVSTDACRAKAKNSAGEWDQGASRSAFFMAHNITKSALKKGKTVVFDSTAVSPSARGDLIKLAHSCKASVHILMVDVAVELAKQRNKERGLYAPMREVPEFVIDRMHASYEDAKTRVPTEKFDTRTLVTDTAKYVAPEAYAPPVIHTRPKEDRELVEKWLTGPNPSETFERLAKNGELENYLPAVMLGVGFDQKSKYHQYTLFEHTMHVLDGVAKQTDDVDMRWAAILHDIGKPESQWMGQDGYAHYYAEPKTDGKGKRIGLKGEAHEVIGARMAHDILQEYGLEPERIRRIVTLVRYHMEQVNNTKQAEKMLRNLANDSYLEDFLVLRRGDRAGKGDDKVEDDGVETMRALFADAKEARERANAPRIKLAVSGGDLIRELKIKPGPAVGVLIQDLNNIVKTHPAKNNRETLVALAREMV